MQKIGEIFSSKSAQKPIKPPAYQWQDLALRIIAELSIPPHKKNSVFQVCKKYDKNFIEKCLDDTKELAEGGEQWKYFFKLVSKL